MGDNSPVEIATEVVVSASAAALGVVNPAAGVAAAAAVPVVFAGVKDVLDRIHGRRIFRRSAVLAAAAKQAGIDADELTRRLESDPEREELLLRTLVAAGEAPLREKLIAYAVALANGTTTDDRHRVAWETAFVRALDDLDSDHLTLLDRFTRTATQLGLAATGTEPDPVMNTLNETQIEMVASDVANPPATVAVLQRHGLIAARTSGGGTFGGGGGSTHWYITAFGIAFLERLDSIGEALRETGNST